MNCAARHARKRAAAQTVIEARAARNSRDGGKTAAVPSDMLSAKAVWVIGKYVRRRRVTANESAPCVSLPRIYGAIESPCGAIVELT